MANARVRNLRGELELTQKRLATVEAENARNGEGWRASSDAWGQVYRHPAVKAVLDGEDNTYVLTSDGGMSLLEATLKALDTTLTAEEAALLIRWYDYARDHSSTWGDEADALIEKIRAVASA
ncbi:hypothetical protein SEA_PAULODIABOLI_338 [Microbacterium phage PauloDiaboli]|nr:hypothetical protein SEA_PAULODIABOLI_338 [Microbacterium phage PauloDiaboli]